MGTWIKSFFPLMMLVLKVIQMIDDDGDCISFCWVSLALTLLAPTGALIVTDGGLLWGFRGVIGSL